MANLVKETIIEQSKGAIHPTIEIVETGETSVFNENDKNLVEISIEKVVSGLGLVTLKSPKESIEEIVRLKMLTE